MILLLVARPLIRFVPLRWWRASLGRVGAGDAARMDDPYRWVVRAVNRAAQRLPGDYVCLPRAMAAQWMLRRRGLPSALVFGIVPEDGSGEDHALHAWVETGDAIVIGDDPDRTYARGLTLVQP